MILNRLGLNDLVEPINRNLEFQLQDPFLLYRNDQGSLNSCTEPEQLTPVAMGLVGGIYGIWFYDKDECARIGQLMNSLVQVATGIDPGQIKDTLGGGRQRRASESDTLAERLNDVKPLQQARLAPTAGAGPGKAGPGFGPSLQQKNVDILQILSRAQDEYDKSKGGAVTKKSEPKPMIDNPNASATKSTSLPKPVPVKVNTNEVLRDSGDATDPDTPSTQISLETLFRRVSLHQDVSGDASRNPKLQQPVPPQATGSTTSQMPPLLQRLMSTTVEEIEREQRGEAPREGRSKPSGGQEIKQSQSRNHATAAKLAASQQKDTSPVVLPLATQVQKSITDSCRGDPFINGDSVKPPCDQLVPYSLPVLQLPRNTETSGQHLIQRGNVTSEPVVGMATPLANRILPPPLAKTGSTSGLITPQALCQTAGQLTGHPGVSTSHTVSSQLSNAASVLLSPMVFQSASAQRVTPPLAPTHPINLPQHTGNVSPLPESFAAPWVLPNFREVSCDLSH
ncbi:hypothetical protein LSAT2_026906 [Lamellibrachia satsuma]|nr:hypothetical protein LSAT2_026906 [Lamellibrachia satsuma]